MSGNADNSILNELMQTIRERKRNPSAKSYTCQLLAGGVDSIGAKITEEAAELIEAAHELSATGSDGSTQDEAKRRAVIHEAADLVYHLFVLLGHCDLELDDVQVELARRFGTSGLEEKASRDKSTDDH